MRCSRTRRSRLVGFQSGFGDWHPLVSRSQWLIRKCIGQGDVSCSNIAGALTSPVHWGFFTLLYFTTQFIIYISIPLSMDHERVYEREGEDNNFNLLWDRVGFEVGFGFRLLRQGKVRWGTEPHYVVWIGRWKWMVALAIHLREFYWPSFKKFFVRRKWEMSIAVSFRSTLACWWSDSLGL